MSTNHTANYNLNQWIKSDQVRMEDFNADNAKLDAALASKASTSALNSLQSVVNSKASTSALNALQSTVSGQNSALNLRNCRFVTGSYTGTGKYGPSDANTLTFPQKPAFVCVVSDDNGMVLNMINGQASTFFNEGGASTLTISWGARSVTWYVKSASASSFAPIHQMNINGVYHYFALLEIE